MQVKKVSNLGEEKLTSNLLNFTLKFYLVINPAFMLPYMYTYTYRHTHTYDAFSLIEMDWLVLVSFCFMAL